MLIREISRHGTNNLDQISSKIRAGRWCLPATGRGAPEHGGLIGNDEGPIGHTLGRRCDPNAHPLATPHEQIFVVTGRIDPLLQSPLEVQTAVSNILGRAFGSTNDFGSRAKISGRVVFQSVLFGHGIGLLLGHLNDRRIGPDRRQSVYLSVFVDGALVAGA